MDVAKAADNAEDPELSRIRLLAATKAAAERADKGNDKEEEEEEEEETAEGRCAVSLSVPSSFALPPLAQSLPSQHAPMSPGLEFGDRMRRQMQASICVSIYTFHYVST